MPQSPSEPQEIILPPGIHSDGSIVDMYGNAISRDEQDKILEVIGGLPVTEKKDTILHIIDNHPISIVEGATGS